MIFYVYFDPEVIAAANAGGPYAVQSLISLLRGFVQNCCLMNFDDWRVDEAIRREVESLPADFDRKVITSLLAILKKRNRFVYCLTSNYAANRSDVEEVLQQAASALLDLLLIKQIDPMPTATNGIEIATLATYQHTSFESERSRLANEGSTQAEGALSETDFMDRHFRKALRYAVRIEICDKLFSKGTANFMHTAKALLHWLENVLADPVGCKLFIHSAKPEGQGDQYIAARLKGFRHGKLSKLPIELQFYELPNPDNVLPHERFILTDQVALEIGRGMDFLDSASGRNRDVSIGYKSPKEVEDLLKSYSAGRQPAITI